MNRADCYTLLGLVYGADLNQIKTAYRRLVRQYHPDLNPDNPAAKLRFMELTEAYKFLSYIATPTVNPIDIPCASPLKRRQQHQVHIPKLSEYEQKLKVNSYELLKKLLRERRLARAIALAEGLAQRLPKDPEVRQWQAITYQQWGRQMVQEQRLQQAKAYLKKALQTDPYNRSLWAAVQQDLRRVEQMI